MPGSLIPLPGDEDVAPLVIPGVVLAYPVVWIGVPAMIHAVVPDVVRSVLSVL